MDLKKLKVRLLAIRNIAEEVTEPDQAQIMLTIIDSVLEDIDEEIASS